MACKSVERFKPGARMWQTTDGQTTEHATEKAVGEFVCARRRLKINIKTSKTRCFERNENDYKLVITRMRNAIGTCEWIVVRRRRWLAERWRRRCNAVWTSSCSCVDRNPVQTVTNHWGLTWASSSHSAIEVSFPSLPFFSSPASFLFLIFSFFPFLSGGLFLTNDG